MLNHNASLREADPVVAALVDRELHRQQNGLQLIASENFASRAVIDAVGTPLTNKYAEGYPGKRYYGGCEVVDEVERLAIDRAIELFGADHANVQPHSGSQANFAAYMALIRPGELLMGLSLPHGGHLTHGHKVSHTGIVWQAVHYGVDPATGRIDYDAVRDQAKRDRPRLIVAGGSAYPRIIDFAAFRSIADEIDAFFLVDMAHFAGLVAGGVHPHPLPHAHVVTATTYKNLRGARGGLILTDDETLARKIDGAIFPGIQGSTILNAIAAKAVCLGEVLKPEFRAYARAVLDNARALAETLAGLGVPIVGGGTDTPLMLVDLRPLGVTGNVASDSLEAAGLTCNKNAVPFDPQPPTVTSGLRFGVSAGTTRGFGVAE
ncbi:MAG: serine hydroxymethyltransferase, partial [Gemmatimonadales bacterium]